MLRIRARHVHTRDALRLVEEGVGVDLADIRLALFVEHVDAAVIQPEDGGAALGGAQEPLAAAATSRKPELLFN